jgi:hypothetical protein
MRVRYSIVLALTAVLALGGAASALATTYSYSAILLGLNEVPPNASPASGMGFLVYDDVAATITANESWSGLTAPATASHIHGPADTAHNAAVIFPFSGVPAATSGAIPQQSFAISTTQVGYLTSGLLYFNVHSSTFPGGEIRGQILPEPTPTGVTSWGKIKRLYR